MGLSKQRFLKDYSVGYYAEDEHRLLVYEFMPRGSLENHLFRRGSYFQPLLWNLQMKVALGTAKGLAFLHSAESFRETLKLQISCVILSSNCKGNIYNFGVVFLEMLSGRKVIDKNRPAGEHNLIEWSKPYLSSKRRVLRIIDTRLEGQYTQSEVLKAANLAIQCLSVDPKYRPSMQEVVASLEGLQDSKGHARTNHSNYRTHTNGGRHHHKRGTDEATARRVDSYPRPSTNPLYAQ